MKLLNFTVESQSEHHLCEKRCPLYDVCYREFFINSSVLSTTTGRAFRSSLANTRRCFDVDSTSFERYGRQMDVVETTLCAYWEGDSSVICTLLKENTYILLSLIPSSVKHNFDQTVYFLNFLN